MKTQAALLMLAVALAACEPTAEEMGATGATPVKVPTVTVHEQANRLALTLRGGHVADSDWARIDAFFAAAAAGRPELVRLTIAANEDSLAVDRIVRRAVAAGYDEDNIAVAPREAANKLDLTAKTYVAVAPNCPQTGHLNLIDGDNMVSSDWGCATVSTFAMQVADPHDLVRGKSGGMTDSVLTTAAIRRLETDKVKKLDSGSTKSAGGAAQ